MNNYHLGLFGLLDAFSKDVEQVAIDHGFELPNFNNLLQKLILIHSEISEAHVVHQDYVFARITTDEFVEHFIEELSDVIMRCLYIATSFGVSWHNAIPRWFETKYADVLRDFDYGTNDVSVHLNNLHYLTDVVMEYHRRTPDEELDTTTLVALVGGIIVYTVRLAQWVGPEMGLDTKSVRIWEACVNKNNHNRTRPYKHGNKRY